MILGILGCALSVPLKALDHVYSKGLAKEVIEEKREDYGKVQAELESYRLAMLKKFQLAQASDKKELLVKVRQRLERDLRREMFPAWYGTAWDFNGTSKTPGEGKIACGYFVSTCLTHLGFKVSRIKLAQQPSQRIIETFMAKSDRKILAGGKSMEVIRAYLKSQGDGIHIVGLDSHVGFISVEGNDMAFIHSSYYRPGAVVKAEPIDARNPLSNSKYRVFGKIFSDEMLTHWLQGKTYQVKT